MKVYCPLGLFESTGAFETKSKWLSNCIDDLHFILLHGHTNKKETTENIPFNTHRALLEAAATRGARFRK